MATFTFGRTVDIHWNGFEVVGPAGTVFSIPDQLYEEFNDDIFPVEPTLTWIDTNEFLTLSNSVSVSTLEGTIPISITTTTSGRNVAISSSTNPAGYNLVADGTGGVIFQAASTGALTSIVGVSPMSTIISGNTASVILNANYQTAGTYVTGVVGTSPISASGTTAITVTIDQAAITGATAATNAQVVRFYVKNTTGTTIPKGSSVYVSGATGDNALISLASATSDPSSSKTLGLTAEAIANDAFGYVIEAGYLTDIDTSATTAGAAVWLGDTPGSLSFVNPPAEPSHSVYLGVVVRVQAINGSILVKVQNGYELDELHDVFVGGVSTALPLVYNSTSSGWVAQALTSVGIADNAVVEAKINAGAVGSAALADNAVVAAKIAAAAVGTVAISSGSATTGQILQANGSGGVSFQDLPTSTPYWYESIGFTNGSAISVPSGPYIATNVSNSPTEIVTSSGTSVLAANASIRVSDVSQITSFGSDPGSEMFTIPSDFPNDSDTSFVDFFGTPDGYLGATSSNGFFSKDGASWSASGIDGWAATLDASSRFSYINGVFFYQDPGPSNTDLYYSTNGLTWTTYTITSFIGRSRIVFDGTNYIWGGSVGKIAKSISYTSASSWVISTPITTTLNISVLMIDNSGTLVAAGTSGFIRTSTDTGATWTTRTSTQTSSEWELGGWNGSTFILCSRGSSLIATSPTGVTWTSRTPSPVITNTQSMAVSSTGHAMICGNTTSYIYTLDGTTWTVKQYRDQSLGDVAIRFIATNNEEFLSVANPTIGVFRKSTIKNKILLSPIDVRSI